MAATWLGGRIMVFLLPVFPVRMRRCAGQISGALTSAGAQVSTMMPRSASADRRCFSAASASARGCSSAAPSGSEMSARSLGKALSTGARADASAPRMIAWRTSSWAPAGASLATCASAKGISARGARLGLATQTCSAHRQRRNRISAGTRSCTKLKSCGQEKPRSQRVCPSTACGRRAARRQSPLSAIDSTASDSIGAPCLPGSFGSSAKNCARRDDSAIASAVSS
mmetsp:Transcript_48975/g.129467  ORF Transcript_48975/g.129467 Transcript_48975/m.129467 type:complete len:227 (+) Transcript_48975:414-1094(+)